MTQYSNSIEDDASDSEVVREIPMKKRNIINVPAVCALKTSGSASSLISLIPTESTTELVDVTATGTAATIPINKCAAASNNEPCCSLSATRLEYKGKKHYRQSAGEHLPPQPPPPPPQWKNNETESERLFREEQEHQQKQSYKKRVQTARQRQR